MPEPFLWGVLTDTNEYHEFRTVPEVAAWIAQYDGVLYAHNGGKFDVHFLREYIESDEPLHIINGRIVRCKIGKCELRDSFSLIPAKLADFSKTEIDYIKLTADKREQHMPEIRQYLRSDCENLLRMVQSFMDDYGQHLTQAGASMRYWKKHYAPKRYVPSMSKGQSQTYRPYYYGGRVQPFVTGYAQTPFKVIDINSAYPRAMMDHHIYGVDSITLPDLPKDRAQWSKCLIELDAVARGCFPLQTKEGTYFPDDDECRHYYVTGWELLAAVELDAVDIRNIHMVHMFGETETFAPYITNFYNKRKEAKAKGDKANDLFSKLFMNSLYGKFGADPENYAEYVLSNRNTELYAQWTALGFTEGGMWGGRHMMTRPLPEDKHRYFNIATAASVTGWVRAFLFRSMRQCKGVLYCDTDSIACADTGTLELGNELGQWKLEADCDEYAIAGKKMYAFHVAGKDRPLHIKKQMPLRTTPERKAKWEADAKCWKIACKGVDLTPAQLIEAAKGGTVAHVASAPNFSIHTDALRFIDRKVKATGKDFRRPPKVAPTAE